MKKEFYRITYFNREDNLTEPYMHQCWNDEELYKYVEYLKLNNKYKITIYKITETAEVIDFLCNSNCLTCDKYKTIKEKNKNCEDRKARNRIINRDIYKAKKITK